MLATLDTLLAAPWFSLMDLLCIVGLMTLIGYGAGCYRTARQPVLVYRKVLVSGELPVPDAPVDWDAEAAGLWDTRGNS
jgi:hypothetical protein